MRRGIVFGIVVLVVLLVILWATTLQIGQPGEDLQVNSDHIGVGTSPPTSEKIAISGAVKIDGQLDLNSHKIVNVADPTDAQDAATKHYVDNLAGDGAPKATSTNYKMYRPYHP